MNSTRIKTLEQSIASEIAPFLTQEGFDFDRRRRTFRKEDGACTQIVNFQVGTRSMEGLFAVNLGIYHPIYRDDPESSIPKNPEESQCLVRERLSMLRETAVTKLFRPLVAGRKSLLKWWLTTPADHWWKFTDNPEETSHSLAGVLKLLQTKGLTWLEGNCNESFLREIYEEHLRRGGKI